MSSKYVGVDVGGTKIAAALFDLGSEAISSTLTVPTASQEGPDGVLAQIAQVVRQVCADSGLRLADMRGVGIGMPSTFDLEKGQTLMLPNIPGDWWGKPVRQILQQQLDNIPIALINDARAFTLAEANLGAGRGYPSVVGITLGTGIGGGIVINGRLHLGLFGSAGEVGHHSINLYGTPDGSGNPGGWEAYASGPAIAAMAVKAVMQGINTGLGRLVDYDLNRITPKTVLQAAEAGDAVAQRILQKAGEYVGAGITNVLLIVAPHCIVIGGGVAELGDWIMKPMWETIRLRCHTVPFEHITIRRAELGGHAGIIGAALQAHQLVTDR